MSVELPGEVAWFLNLVGVNWPNVNEDQVRVFAGHVRDFAANIEGTHQAATSTIRKLAYERRDVAPALCRTQIRFGQLACGFL